MRNFFILGMALAISAMLLISCNKNNYDLTAIETVEGSGQWKLPIGNVHTTLGKVLDQLGESDLISYDADGNLQITYHYGMDNMLVGAQLMNIGSVSGTCHFDVDNPINEPLPVAIDTFLVLEQNVQLSAEGVRIVSATVKEGNLITFVTTNLVDIDYIIFRSPDILDASGKPLEAILDETNNGNIGMAGHSIVVDEQNTLHFSWEVHYKLYQVVIPQFHFDATVGLEAWKFRSLSGYVDEYPSHFAFESDFQLPMGKISGELTLVDARLQISEKNTFDLTARLDLDTAALYGDGVEPSMLFSHYPTTVDIVPAADYTVVTDETMTITVNSKHNALVMSGNVIFNPGGVENLISVYDTSCIGLAIDATMPMKFNIPGVCYLDTIDLNLSGIELPELVKEILLGININSELPFNLSAQLFTYDSVNACVTDSLMDAERLIAGCFDGNPVNSNIELDVTQSRLSNLLSSNKLIMRLGLNTDNHDVILNLDNGLGMTIKADVIYGGGVDINQ